MNSFNPTTKTQEALQDALQTASSNGNPDIRRLTCWRQFSARTAESPLRFLRPPA